MKTAKLSWWFLLENWVILTQKSCGRNNDQRNLGFFPPFNKGCFETKTYIFLTLEPWKHPSVVFYCNQLLWSLLRTLIFGVIYRQRLPTGPNGNLIPVVNRDRLFSPGPIWSTALSATYFLPFKRENDGVLMAKAGVLGFMSGLLQTPSNSLVSVPPDFSIWSVNGDKTHLSN